MNKVLKDEVQLNKDVERTVRGRSNKKGRKNARNTPKAKTSKLSKAQRRGGPKNQSQRPSKHLANRKRFVGPRNETGPARMPTHIEGIAATIALPAERATAPLALTDDGTPSTTAGPRQYVDASFNTTPPATDWHIPGKYTPRQIKEFEDRLDGGGGFQIEANEMVAVAFRCAQLSAVIYDANIAAQQMYYTFLGQQPTDDFVVVAPSNDFDVKTLGGIWKPLPVPLMTTGGAIAADWSPHGTERFAGALGDGGAPQDDRRWFWFDIDTSVNYTLGDAVALSATDTWSVGFDLWTPEGIIEKIIQSAVSFVHSAGNVSGGLTLPVSGWYAPSVKSLINNNIGIKIIYVGSATDIFRHLALDGYTERCEDVKAIRVSGVSIKYANRTNTFNQEGTILTMQARKGTFWTDYIGVWEEVRDDPQSTDFNLDKGAYRYLTPMSVSDMEYKSYLKTSEGIIQDSFFPFTSLGDYLILYLKVADPTVQVGYFTFNNAVEYMSSNTWDSQETLKGSDDDYRAAMLLIKETPPSHENPTHLKEIFGDIAKGVSWLWKEAPAILSTGSAIAKALA